MLSHNDPQALSVQLGAVAGPDTRLSAIPTAITSGFGSYAATVGPDTVGTYVEDSSVEAFFLYEFSYPRGGKYRFYDKAYYPDEVTSVDEFRMIGAFIAFDPYGIHSTSLPGFTPSEPWHPTKDIGLGISEVAWYVRDTQAFVTTGVNYTAVLMSLWAPPPR
jgi:hypothetical protein